MLINEKQQMFLNLRVLDGKSFDAISEEIDVPVHVLKEWSVVLIDNMEEMRADEIDRISSQSGMTSIQHYRNLADIYKRLKEELDKRDFSGLPTDKLYYLFNDVHERFSQSMEMSDDDWMDYLNDDYDPDLNE